jgi:putative FmdB family regulatory protein
VPTYTYACTACGNEFDAVQSISDSALTTCPSCQGSLRKVFHPVGVAFKGSGFYRTDSREGGTSKGSDAASRDSGSGPDSSGSKGSAAAGAPSAPKADRKPAASGATTTSTAPAKRSGASPS